MLFVKSLTKSSLHCNKNRVYKQSRQIYSLSKRFMSSNNTPNDNNNYKNEKEGQSLQLILEYMDGFRKSQAMFAGVKLGLFDILRQKGSLSIPEITKELQVSEDAIERLLIACNAMNLVELDSSSKERKYTMTDSMSKLLCEGTEESLKGYIIHSCDTLYPLWGNLDQSVKVKIHPTFFSFKFAMLGSKNKDR